MGKVSSRKKKRHELIVGKRRELIVRKYAFIISDLVNQALGYRSPVKISNFNIETKNGVIVEWFKGDIVKIEGKKRRVRNLDIKIIDDNRGYGFRTAVVGCYTYEERDAFSQEIINMMIKAKNVLRMIIQ